MNGQPNGNLTVIEDEEGQLAGFGAVQSQVTLSTAIQAMGMTIDKQIATARMFPRSVARFKAECSQLLREDVETARSAEYAKPVGGGTVKGPSVRLAELAASCWGNLTVELSEPVVGDKSVSVKASAWDLQRNYRQEGISTASIIGKNGRYPAHLIETTCMACAAKARRNAILNVIPRAYINDLLEVAKAVASGNKKPLEQVRREWLDWFARNYKVQADQIFEMFAVAGIDDLNEEHLAELGPISVALKEGHAKPEEFFTVKVVSKADEIKAKIEERKKGATPPAPVPAPATAPAATATKPDARPDRKQFTDLLADYETAGGDTGAWLAEHNFADEGQALESSKPALSKLIVQLTKDIDARKAAAKAFADSDSGMAAVRG